MFSILILVLLFVVMYFLMIRPQKKREKETKAMRAGLGVGDEIVTIGGLCCKVVKTKEENLCIKSKLFCNFINCLLTILISCKICNLWNYILSDFLYSGCNFF